MTCDPHQNTRGKGHTLDKPGQRNGHRDDCAQDVLIYITDDADHAGAVIWDLPDDILIIEGDGPFTLAGGDLVLTADIEPTAETWQLELATADAVYLATISDISGG